jgi:UDP-N-acetyl-D-glucosamine dehydrogenase
MRMLNTQGKAMRGAKVMIMGVAYKKNVSDCRESPSQVGFAI